MLGDVHISTTYDANKYKGTKANPARKAPAKNDGSGTHYHSILGEKKQFGGTLNYREFITYNRRLAYPEYIVHFKRL